jgi:hypothetical protein
MAWASTAGTGRKRRPAKSPRTQKTDPVPRGSGGWSVGIGMVALLLGSALVYAVFEFHATYAINFQSPVKIKLQWPLVIARRTDTPDAYAAQVDQKYPLTAYQQYACRKFGPACRVALAIQRAENPQGKCETYHYNSDGTLDWGYFQINTVHLQRPGLVLRDLLDCRANIDFAYQLFIEERGFSAWSTYKNGAYRKFLHH